MQGEALINQLRRRFEAQSGGSLTDVGLANRLGLTTARLAQLKAAPALSALQVARLLAGVDAAATARASREMLRTLVEFYPIDAVVSARGTGDELFSVKLDDVVQPYRRGLRDELEASKGIYLFYDSRGRALYAGKAKDQSLWREMNLAYNRDRGQVQSLARVNHPERSPFRRTREKGRQILTCHVPLSDLASYFSAYAVQRDMIDDMEALLIRAFPNDLLNIKREHFKGGKQK